MANTPKIPEPLIGNIQRNWGWILGLGILFVILGCVGLGMVVGLTLVSMYFFAALLMIAGFSHLIDVFKHRDWQGVVWQGVVSILYIAAGCVVFYDPFLASSLITALFASILIVIGVTRMAMALSLKKDKGWLWLLLAGLTAIILGVLILLQWPVSGLWVIGLFIAIEMIVTGWTYIFIAMALRV